MAEFAGDRIGQRERGRKACPGHDPADRMAAMAHADAKEKTASAVASPARCARRGRLSGIWAGTTHQRRSPRGRSNWRHP
ncbi:hypothetical protein BV509_19350 [Rhodovulum sulfidophilum]|nr:hypothetical protein BV509_19350 [Rhodovulum sulfidophilum]